MTRSTEHNSGLAKGGLTTCFYEIFVLRKNLSAKNPALHQAAKRKVTN